ncbi:hypothetical protein L873DRAFT_1412054 [Choiromyces venosus 120613-1]|uniref:Secreted protein n=1 Tax=Choiromyces venosus 120613-1 TaxID=1336337 RepID=A0A3N4J8P9_9PEZI|nr:hypothetical protein L873DRAFT_1412054 [Choiromyces venosus 120613-1]
MVVSVAFLIWNVLCTSRATYARLLFRYHIQAICPRDLQEVKKRRKSSESIRYYYCFYSTFENFVLIFSALFFALPSPVKRLSAARHIYTHTRILLVFVSISATTFFAPARRVPSRHVSTNEAHQRAKSNLSVG